MTNEDLQVVPEYLDEEEACWAILTREREASTPVVEVIIGIDALVQEVAQ